MPQHDTIQQDRAAKDNIAHDTIQQDRLIGYIMIGQKKTEQNMR